MALNLIPVERKDFVVDECGQLIPPPGHLIVPLFRVIPFLANFPASGEGGLPPQPFSRRVNNNANTTFVCAGLMCNSNPRFRVKWPNGLYLSQSPSGGNGGATGPNFPQGMAGNGLCLNAEQYIPAGGRITVEISGAPGDSGDCRIQFWGFLLYLVKLEDCGKVEAACLVGYSSNGKPNLQKLLVENPMHVLAERARYLCNLGNIYANEVQLSNQCEDLLQMPMDFESPEYVLGPNELSTDNAVIVPGADDFVLKGWRPIVRLIEDATTSEPTVGIRFPNGYSMTGGDLIPVTKLFRCPVFGSIRLRAGDRIIVDVGNINGVIGDGDIALRIEFNGARLRRRDF